jgi:hypothetical protein
MPSHTLPEPTAPLTAPTPAAPPCSPLPPPATLSPWAWATAFVLGQPNAHRVVRAFFIGLIGLSSVLVGGLRGCHG